MILNYKYDYHLAYKRIVEEELKLNNIPFEFEDLTEVKILKKISSEDLEKIRVNLAEYGIHILDNPKDLLVQKIKNLITEMLQNGEENIMYKTSIYLSEKLQFSYGYLSNLFSEVALTTIENYIILQKIEMAKTLLIEENLSLTEIAYKLHYSSVAHLSSQFKNKTGLTPSEFQQIMNRRRRILEK
jgi:AraC-like DNA-binding protein